MYVSIISPLKGLHCYKIWQPVYGREKMWLYDAISINTNLKYFKTFIKAIEVRSKTD